MKLEFNKKASYDVKAAGAGGWNSPVMMN